MESGPLVVSLLLRIATVQASLVTALLLKDQRQLHACKLFPVLQWKLRPRINTSVNKSLCQALESSPVILLLIYPTYCSDNLSTFSRGNLKSAGLTNAFWDSQKLDEIVTTMALLLLKNGPRSNLRASNFYKFPGGASPQTPLVSRACLLIYAYIHIRHPPPFKNPGYGPETCMKTCNL